MRQHCLFREQCHQGLGLSACAATLVNDVGAHLLGFGFLIELCFLNGRQHINHHRIEAVMAMED